MTALPNFGPVLPELFVAVAALGLLMIGVFRKDDSTRPITLLSILVMVGAMMLVSSLGAERQTTMSELFVVDRFAGFAKALLLLAGAFATAMALPYLEKEKVGKFEYPVVTLFATLGMMMMVSANDFMSLYLGLELQSLSLYVLAAYRRDSARSTESGLKYFVLGSLASGLLLYGVSLLYGFAGTTGFDGLAKLFTEAHHHGAKPSTGVIAGLVFVLAGLSFKISAAPFHMWAPDVYEGAPTPVTSFFAVAPKIAAVCLLVRVMFGPFAELIDQWRQIVEIIAVASMVVGAFAAIVQTNIKRLMAYSSIGHVGFILVGVAAGTDLGVQGVLIYLAIYLFMNVGTFAVILCMRQKGTLVEGIDDLAGLSKSSPMMAFVMAVLMFSMAGIPPLAGFWGKFYVFLAAVESGLYTLAVIGVLSSVVSAYYYLRIIKIMYFEEPAEAFDRPESSAMGVVMALSTLAVVAFTFLPAPLVSGAKAAAQVLFAQAG
jgi:NADH-quinone oxidoreductase subunit N